MRNDFLSLCNLKILGAICFLCTACNKDGILIKEQDLSCCRQFLSEAMAFDYCGSFFTADDVKIAAEKFTKEYLIGIHLTEHKYLNQLTDYLHLVELFERDVLLGAVPDIREDTKRIKEALHSQRDAVLSPQMRFDFFRYTQNVMQLWLSMVRIREAGHCSEDIVKTISRDLLGDELFDLDISGCDWIHIGDDWPSRLKVFRDFVQLSFYIVEADADHAGSAKYSIGEISDPRLLRVKKKRGVQFTSNKNGWTLFWSRVGVAKNFLEGAHLIPQVTGVTCITNNRTDLTGIVHLSSDFAKRRREIFRHEECWQNVRLFVGKEHIMAERSYSDKDEREDIDPLKTQLKTLSHIGGSVGAEQQERFGVLPDWKTIDEGQRCILLTTHYMINDKTNKRDIDKFAVVALYHNENEGQYRLRFVIRKRDSAMQRWEEVTTGSCIIVQKGDNIEVNTDSKAPFSGKVNVKICNTEEAKKYLVINMGV